MTRIFFSDRDLGKRFPEALVSAGLKVERHDIHFKADCADEEWLSVAGQRGWVVLTRDRRIRYKPNELAAVVRYSVAMLVIMGKAPHADLARAFVNSLPRVEGFLARYRPPVIGKVRRPSPAQFSRRPNAAGRVELWYPK